MEKGYFPRIAETFFCGKGCGKEKMKASFFHGFHIPDAIHRHSTGNKPQSVDSYSLILFLRSSIVEAKEGSFSIRASTLFFALMEVV